jgi:hypothetical protein
VGVVCCVARCHAAVMTWSESVRGVLLVVRSERLTSSNFSGVEACGIINIGTTELKSYFEEAMSMALLFTALGPRGVLLRRAS